MFLFSMGYATPLVMLGLAGRKVGEGALQLGRNFSQSAGATLLNTLAAVLIVYGSYQACASVEELLQRTAGS